METTNVTCTGCGKEIPESEAVDLRHADTYSGTTWHCQVCAERCTKNDAGDPHCGGSECGVGPGHYDTRCSCKCDRCNRQRNALDEAEADWRIEREIYTD